MVVQLVVTPEMIKCFHECTEEGNYLQLFEDYEQFFESFKENLSKVNFSEPLYSAIIKEFDFLLNCLSTWVPSTALPWDKETINPGLYLLGFLPRFVLAMQTRNWNDFYKQFLPIIDLMIETARRQEIIDLKIGFGTELYETFNLRDEAVNPQETQLRVSAICTSGHLSPFDCDSNCRRFLRSLYGSKRINRKNVGKLVLTEEMITCFHECAEKRDFRILFEKYSAFFDILLESLGKVNPDTESLSTFIFKNSKLLLGYLTKWDPNEMLPWDNDSIRIENRYSGLIPHLHIAMVIQDWDGFYEQHRQTADMLIKEARSQELIDLKIEYEGKLYDSFKDRDAPEQQHFNSFIRKYGSNRHFSMLYNENGKRPPINFLRRTLSGVGPKPELKEFTNLTTSKSVAKHVTFAEPESKTAESTREIPIKLVKSSVPEVKKTVSPGIPEVKESDSNRVTEVKASPKVSSGPDTEDELYQIECRYQRVLKEQISKKHSTRIPEVKEGVPSRATETRQTAPAAVPKAYEFGSNRFPEVKETPNVFPSPQREVFHVNQNEEINRLECRIHKLLAKQLDLIQVETDRKHKNLETRMNFLEESLKTVESNQRTFNQKLQQMESRFEISMEMKLRKFGANLASANRPVNSTKQIELLEEQLQFRELILHQKIDEIKIREQTLDNRMNELMELVESKMDNFGEKRLPEESKNENCDSEKKKVPDQTQEDIDFDKKLAEQLLDYEVRLRRIQKKRKEMNVRFSNYKTKSDFRILHLFFTPGSIILCHIETMVVHLVITEDMIKCFHSCAKKGDYQPLFKDYSQFFESLTENLCKVNFSIPFYSEVVKESKYLLNFISTWVPNTDVPWEKKTSNPNLFILDFLPRLVLAMQTRNWDGFYKRFSPFIDIAIGKARRQGIIDMKIEFRLKVYDTFKLRDNVVSSTCKVKKCEPNQPANVTVASKVPEDKQTVPTEVTKFEEPDVPEVKGSSLAQVPDVKEKSVPSKTSEVQQTVPAGITAIKTPDSKIEESDPTEVPGVKELSSTKVQDVKKSVPTEKPKIKQTDPTEIPKVEDIDSTKVPEVNELPEVISEPKPENLQINHKDELCQIEARLQKLLTEQLDLIRIDTDKKQEHLETRINFLEENLKTVESNQKTIDQKLQQMESRLENAMEMKFKKFEENLTSETSQSKPEDPTKRIELLEEQLQVREMQLHQKIDEIKIREQTLDNRMNELMELMESKMDSSKAKNFPDEPQVDSSIPEKKKIKQKTQEDIDFDKKLAEQLLDYEVRLKRIQKKRKEINVRVESRFEKKMVVHLVITEDMIKCFHSCAKKGDYQPLFKDYAQFFESLTENLCKINFSIPFYSEVVKESKYLLNFISTWVPNTDVPWEKKTSNPNLFILDFFPHLVLAMQTKNWDGFYKRFSPFIDITIGTARRQEIFDLKIEFRSEVYDTFKFRDNAVSSTCKALKCESSQPANKNVPSKVPEDKQTVPIEVTKVEEPGLPEAKRVDPTSVPEVKESGSAEVPEVKESVPSKISEVQQTVPAGITDVKEVDSKIEESGPTKVPGVKELSSTKVQDVKKSVPTEKPKVKQTDPTEIPKVEDIDSTKVPEVNELPEVISEPKPENLQINHKDELCQIEARLQKLLAEQIDLIRIGTERKCKNLEARIDVLEENLRTVDANQKTINQKLQQMESRLERTMETKLKKFEENFTLNENEDPTKKLELLEEQLQFRELILHQKIDEIKIREQTLDNRMNELMELMGSKMGNSKAKNFPDNTRNNSSIPEVKKIPEKTQEDIDFDKKLAEQLLDYEERLRRIQKKTERDEKHEKGSTKMVIQLIITPGMIKCFHECTAKSDYKQLFNDYPQFFASLEENVTELEFGDPLPSTIIDEFSFFRSFIYAWEPNTRLPMNKESIGPDHCMLKFLPRLCLAMQTRNWDDFYEKYLPTIDLLIQEARKQKIIDLKIGFGPELYDTFSQRDQAANQLNQKQQVETPQHRVSALCSNGHSSPFDCNSNCIRFLRSLYGSKRVKGRKPLEESAAPTKQKSSKHVTFAELDTEKSEDGVVLDIPKGLVASKVAETKGIIRANDIAVKHEVHTGIDKKSEGGFITEIPIKFVPEVKDTVPPEIDKVKELGSTSVPEVKELGSTNVSEVNKTVPSRVTEAKKTPPVKTNEVEEVGPICAPEVKETDPVKDIEVNELGSTNVSAIKQSGPSRVPEMKPTVQTEIPILGSNPLGSTSVSELKDTPNVPTVPETENVQANQRDEIIQLESRLQKLLKEQLDLIRIESDRKHKILETRIIFLEENLKTVEIKQETFDQKLQQMESRFESSMETGLKKFGENLTSTIAQNKNEGSTKKLELLEKKLQLRELILHQKIDEIKIREQTLDNRMNQLMELVERKMTNFDEPQDDGGNSEEQKTLERTEEDIDFDKKLAEQLLDYEERLRRIQKKRKEMIVGFKLNFCNDRICFFQEDS
ncbi:hypothetical protein CAEBREN_32754 [Caenorhabditis brenneri]|uniref:Uncharacterized protein n=1 Tax=Caenorhabditis brenneri TaxID=135651 RepID=G0MA69_CAEBE|nr:hypothetical protein CAEBREN_32754 [Caenorhabditis brenneri]